MRSKKPGMAQKEPVSVEYVKRVKPVIPLEERKRQRNSLKTYYHPGGDDAS